MSETPILGLPQLAPNQNNKVVTANDAFSILERSLNDVLKVDLSAGTVALAEADFRRHQVFHVEAGVAGSTLTIPNQKRFFAVYNKSAVDCTVETATPANSVTVLVNSYVIMFADGVNGVIKVADSAASALPPAFTNLTDTPSSFTGSAGSFLKVNPTEDGLEFLASLNLANLDDVDPYTNQYYARVKADGSGIEWVAANPGGETEFLNLNDTPGAYTGVGGHLVRVNAGETALEFLDASAAFSFVNLTDSPSSFTGAEGQIVTVNTTGDGLEYQPFPSFGSPITRSVDEDNPGFELGFVAPWEVDIDDELDVSVEQTFNSVAAHEADHFLVIDKTGADTVTVYRIFDLNVVATNAELDNNAKITIPYAYNTLEAGSSGSITVETLSDTDTVLTTQTVGSLTTTVGTWDSGVIQMNIPVSARKIKITLEATSASPLTYGFDNLKPLLTVTENIAFTELPDAPSDYATKAGQFVRVNTAEDALEFATLDFLALSGTPSTYTGTAGSFLAVNTAEDALELVEINQLPTPNAANEGRYLQADAQGEPVWAEVFPDETNQEGKYLRLDTQGNLEWAEQQQNGVVFSGATGNRSITNADLEGNKVLKQLDGGVNTVTVPSGLTGTEPVTVIQDGAGQTTFVAGTGVTIKSADSLLALRARYSSATLIPDGTDTFYLVGDLA